MAEEVTSASFGNSRRKLGSSNDNQRGVATVTPKVRQRPFDQSNSKPSDQLPLDYKNLDENNRHQCPSSQSSGLLSYQTLECHATTTSTSSEKGTATVTATGRGTVNRVVTPRERHGNEALAQQPKWFHPSPLPPIEQTLGIGVRVRVLTQSSSQRSPRKTVVPPPPSTLLKNPYAKKNNVGACQKQEQNSNYEVAPLSVGKQVSHFSVPIANPYAKKVLSRTVRCPGGGKTQHAQTSGAQMKLDDKLSRVSNPSPRNSKDVIGIQRDQATPMTLKRPGRSAPTSNVVNPYKKKRTLGLHPTTASGQSQRLIMAQKKGNDTSSSDDGSSMNEPLPQKMNIFEKFFASLLRSSALVYYQAAEGNDDETQIELWSTLCRRHGFDLPPCSPIQDQYDSAEEHFQVRACLVLEEARHAISQGLFAKWGGASARGRGGSPGTIPSIFAHSAEGGNSHGHVRVTFHNRTPFVREQLLHIRPGTVYECLPREASGSIEHAVLGVVTNAARFEAKCALELMVFTQELPSLLKRNRSIEFRLTPLASLITELRSFEALTKDPAGISFLDNLMGSESTSVRKEEDKKSAASKNMYDPTALRLRRLNDTQSKAAWSFLNAPENSITLVQGPPGTGELKSLLAGNCLVYFIDTMMLLFTHHPLICNRKDNASCRHHLPLSLPLSVC